MDDTTPPLPDDTATPQEMAQAYARALMARGQQQPNVFQQVKLPEMSDEQNENLNQKEQFGNLETTIGGALAPIGQHDLQSVQQARSLYNPYKKAQAQAALNRSDAYGGAQKSLEDLRAWNQAHPKIDITKTADGVVGVNSRDASQVTNIGGLPPAPRRLGKGGGVGATVAPATPQDQDRLDFNAKQFNLLGMDGLPPDARGKTGIAYARAIASRAHELDPTASPGMAHVNLTANKADLVDAVKQASAMDVNDEKATADIGSLRTSMKPLLNTGSPWVNKTFHELQENTGNPDVAGYLTAMTVARAQINKVINSATLTESARQEANDMLKDSATPAQTERVLGVIEQDMSRSKDAMHKRVSNAQGRIGGTAAPTQGGNFSLGDGPVKLIRVSDGQPFTAPNGAAGKKAIDSKKYQAVP